VAVELSRLAERLRDAYRRGPVPPLRDGLKPDDAEGAYEVQAINTRYWVDQGRRVIGRKIGLTSQQVQKQLGVSHPDCGVLFQDMLISDGGSIDPSRLLQPRVEAEVALVLGRDVAGPEPTVCDVLAATEYVLPALEIPDSRISDWRITFADTVADNASSGCFVLGRQPCTVANRDLWSCGMVMEVNGRIVSTGVGAACLGHPLNAAAWLARAVFSRGETLRTGDILMTGALGPLVPLPPGASVRATIGGLGEVSVCVQDSREQPA
jgi:2-keto-4-pentenoate hydratase